MTQSARHATRQVARPRIVGVVGARPNFMKIAPIMSELSADGDIDAILIHTGQHYDDAMSEDFRRSFRLRRPQYNLGVGSGTVTEQTANIMIRLEPVLAELTPDCVVVVGDVNSTLAAALVAARLRIPLAHVEAGLRSFDDSMPEELNRRVTDAVSDVLFTTSRDANANLQREGIDHERVFFVGNVMIDTLLRYRSAAEELRAPARYGVKPGGYALLTLHRPSNVDTSRDFERMLDAIQEIQMRLPVVFPAHPRTIESLRRFELEDRARRMDQLVLLDPLGYLEFVSLMSHARLVLTDSGGVQEETTILGVPCLTLRDNTERPVTVSEGTNELVGTDPERIVAALERLMQRPSDNGRVPELWDGKAAARIVSILRSKLARR